MWAISPKPIGETSSYCGRELVRLVSAMRLVNADEIVPDKI